MYHILCFGLPFLLKSTHPPTLLLSFKLEGMVAHSDLSHGALFGLSVRGNLEMAEGDYIHLKSSIADGSACLSVLYKSETSKDSRLVSLRPPSLACVCFPLYSGQPAYSLSLSRIHTFVESDVVGLVQLLAGS